ncbi:MAG: zinc-ribbon domain-containing protein [Bacteroidota bacterium]
MTKKCTNCGFDNLSFAQFCSECGHKLGEEPSRTISEGQEPETNQQAKVATLSQSRNAAVAILSVLAVGLVTLLIYFILVKPADEKASGKTNRVTIDHTLFAQNFWQQSPLPFQGGVRSFLVIGNHLLAATDGGGVFLSSDQGKTWIAANKGLTNLYCFSLASTVGGGNIYLGTSQGGVFVSNDNGTSWREFSNGLPSRKGKLDEIWYPVIFCFSSVGSSLFIGTTNGVFLKDEDDRLWIPVNNGIPDNTIVYCLASDGVNLFAGTYDSGVFLSTDKGKSWKRMNAGLTNMTVISLAIIRANLLAGTNGGVFLSSDKGKTWATLSPGLTNSTINALIAGSDKTNRINIFAGTYGQGIFISTDNGSTWTEYNSGLTNKNIRCFVIDLNGFIYAGIERGPLYADYGGVFRTVKPITQGQ